MATPQPTSIWLPKQSTKKTPQIRTGSSPPLPTPSENVRLVSFEEMRPMNHINLIIYFRMGTFDNTTCCMSCARWGVHREVCSLVPTLFLQHSTKNGETSNKTNNNHSKYWGLVLRRLGLDPMLQSRPKRQQSANRSAAILAHCSPPCEGFRSVGREHGKSSPMGSLGTMGRLGRQRGTLEWLVLYSYTGTVSMDCLSLPVCSYSRWP